MREISELIIRLQQSSDLNRLSQLDNGIVFEEPLVGVADGHDPLFAEYKSVIGDFHLTPEEALLHAAREFGLPSVPGESGPVSRVRPISVICWVLPFAKHIKKSNAAKEVWSSIKWGHA